MDWGSPPTTLRDDDEGDRFLTVSARAFARERSFGTLPSLGNINSESPEFTPLVLNPVISEKQRFRSYLKALVPPIIIFLALLTLGTLVFKYGEDWEWRDALLFCTMTLTTVGYVDFSPVKHWTQLFCVAYIYVGLILIGVALGYVGVAVLKQGQRSAWKSLGIPEPHQPRTLTGRGLQMFQSSVRFFRRYGLKIMLSLSVVVCVNTIGTVVFVISEQWGIIEALYFSTVMSTTIAVASEELTQAFTIWFTIPYCITGTVIMAFALGNLADVVIKYERDRMEERAIRIQPTEHIIRSLGSSSEGVSEQEWVEFILMRMRRVTQDELRRIKERFKKQADEQAGLIRTSTIIVDQEDFIPTMMS